MEDPLHGDLWMARWSSWSAAGWNIERKLNGILFLKDFLGLPIYKKTHQYHGVMVDFMFHNRKIRSSLDITCTILYLSVASVCHI